MGPQAAGADAHVVDLLESYLLGDLSPDDEETVEAHLLRCAACLEQSEWQSDLGVLVATLPAATVHEIDTAGRASDSAPVGPGRPVGSAARGRPVASPTRDDRNRPPSRRGSAWGARRLAGVAAALVLGIALGAGGWALLGPDQRTGVSVGAETPSNLSNRLSVTLTDRADGGLDVQAVVVGLRPGVGFELIAVGTDQHVYSVTSGRAGGGPQQLVGTVAVPSARIMLFAVVAEGDTVVAISVR